MFYFKAGHERQHSHVQRHAITHPWDSEMPYVAVHVRCSLSCVCRLLPQAMPQHRPDEGSNSSDPHMIERQVLSVAGMRFSVSVEWPLRSTFTVRPSRSVNFPEWYDSPVIRSFNRRTQE